jgi:hypothetical protein
MDTKTRRSPSGGRRRFTRVLGVFLAGLVLSALPRGTFGAHDVPLRAAGAGAVAVLTTGAFILDDRHHTHSRAFPELRPATRFLAPLMIGPFKQAHMGTLSPKTF